MTWGEPDWAETSPDSNVTNSRLRMAGFSFGG